MSRTDWPGAIDVFRCERCSLLRIGGLEGSCVCGGTFAHSETALWWWKGDVQRAIADGRLEWAAASELLRLRLASAA